MNIINDSICPQCSKPFPQNNRSWKRYCSAKCQVKSWQRRNSSMSKAMALCGIDQPIISKLTCAEPQVFTKPSIEDAKAGIWYATFPLAIRYSPGCYGYFSNGFYLYIGSTVSRMVDRIMNHHVIGKRFPIQETDFLHIWLIDGDDCRNLETLLIHTYAPRYNAVGSFSSEQLPAPPSFDLQLSLSLPICSWCKKPYNPSSVGTYNGFCSGHCHGMTELKAQGRIA